MAITYNPITTTGSTGYTYTVANTDTSTCATVSNGSSNLTPNTLQVKGDAEFEGEVKIKGKSLSDTLSKLEERLSILHPNEKLEEKWEKLRELRKEYMELEVDIIEKEKIWATLKR